MNQKERDADFSEQWSRLAAEIKAQGVSNSTVLAVMPRHEPARIMTSSCEGIYPVWEMRPSKTPKSKYYG
jgi:ribonucleotide reductase alpha subunit